MVWRRLRGEAERDQPSSRAERRPVVVTSVADRRRRTGCPAREPSASVLAQTYRDFEIIGVDDGSTDETWEVLQSYGDRLRAVRKQDGGVATALNRGIEEMRNRWFAWLSHDDLWLPEKLERQVAFLAEQPEARGCYTDFLLIDEAGSVVGARETPFYPRQEAIRQLFASMYINGSSVIVARECFDAVGLFSASFRHTQDADMWIRLLRRFELLRLPEKLIKSRQHPGQDSVRVASAQVLEVQAFYQHMFDELGVAGLFPDLAARAHEPEVIARAHVWLGDVVGPRYEAYEFSNRHYRQALAADLSWSNPARLKLLRNWTRDLIGPSGMRLVRGARRLFRR